MKGQGINIIMITCVILFTGGQLHAVSVFLKNGSIIEGAIVKRTAREVVIKNDTIDRLTIDSEKIKRIVKSNSYKKKYRMYRANGSFVDVYIVGQTTKNYVVRDDLGDAREFTIAKKSVLRKVPAPDRENPSRATDVNELILVGQGQTWDSLYVGLGAAYAVSPGLLGKNFRDGFGPSVKFYNSPARALHWGLGFSGIYFRTVEKTQLLEVGNMLFNFDATLGYSMELVKRRVALTFYGGAGYSLFMLGTFGDQKFDSGGASAGGLYESSFYHSPSVITGIQIPVRIFRRTNAMPFIEHRWFPVSKTYLGLFNIGMTFNW